MKNQQLEEFLKSSLSDLQLSNDEKNQLRDMLPALDLEQARFIRNRAFDLVRQQLDETPENSKLTLKWLESVIKTLDVTTAPEKINASADFSPGESCKNKILNMLHQTRYQVDICVFTIADNQITAALLNAHQRGIKLRIITDNDKSLDDGSDVDELRQAGIPLRMDHSPYHMHHKFAIFDNNNLLNGSFNWTLSATLHNYENLLITDNPVLVSAYRDEFNRLWQCFSG